MGWVPHCCPAVENGLGCNRPPDQTPGRSAGRSDPGTAPIDAYNRLTSQTGPKNSMAITYSTYEAKARFSEVIRHVREGRIVTVTYQGEAVAEIRPLAKPATIEERLEDLRARGILSGPSRPRSFFDRGTRVPGALQKFLEERD